MKRLLPWLTAIAVGAALLVIVLAANDRRMDLSTGRTYTLAPSTRHFLDRVKTDATIEIFYAKDQPGYADVADLARRIANQTSRLRVAFKNPDGRKARDLNVASGAVAVVPSNGKVPTVVRNPDEADLAAAIADAAGLRKPLVRPNVAPSQPLFPTALGRRLLWLLPAVAVPLAVAVLGVTITWHRRRVSR